MKRIRGRPPLFKKRSINETVREGERERETETETETEREREREREGEGGGCIVSFSAKLEPTTTAGRMTAKVVDSSYMASYFDPMVVCLSVFLERELGERPREELIQKAKEFNCPYAEERERE